MVGYQVCLLVCLAVALHAAPQGYQPSYEKGMPYAFEYAVKDDYSGNDYGQREQSDGNLVQGEYRVLLPDTRYQIVSYNADHDTGFLADVRYEGDAVYPPHQPSYGPSYA